MATKPIWYVEFPTYQYNEDVKDVATKNKLTIIDAKFRGENEQCSNEPKLTKKGAIVKTRKPRRKKEE